MRRRLREAFARKVWKRDRLSRAYGCSLEKCPSVNHRFSPVWFKFAAY
jgi:hypothetical protein